MSTQSKLHRIIINLLALTAALIVLPGGSALAQHTPDKDQLVEQPKPYSPFVDQHFPQ